jgi:hypothetical protein
MRNLSDYFFTFKSVNSYELDFNHKNIIKPMHVRIEMSFHKVNKSNLQ